ncbi:MAG: beta-ketoacyl synthase [Planctomycetaceae bacterium]
MERERVFITGLGAVSCVGSTKADLWESLTAGRCGLRQLTVHDTTELPVTIGGEIAEIDDALATANGKLNVKRMDRATQFAVWAAQQAISDSRLTPSELGSRCGVIIGAGLSGMATLQTQTENLVRRGAKRVSPFTIPMLMPNAAPANVGMAFSITGPCYTTSSACSSSAHAIANAFDLLRSGQMDVVISGGTESSMTRLGIASFCKMGAMSDAYNDRPLEAVRPFEANRKGLIMSEGAGLVVLESESSMRKRAATPYAELIGYGSTSDSHHIVAPDPEAKGASLAIQQAIDATGQTAGEIAATTYINAHGTATELNDLTETLAIRKAFKEHADRVQVSSTKSMTGHMIGAAGGIELIASALALREGVLPPTINYDVPDPKCDLDYVPNEARQSDIEFAFSNSFGFGGHNVCLALKRC